MTKQLFAVNTGNVTRFTVDGYIFVDHRQGCSYAGTEIGDILIHDDVSGQPYFYRRTEAGLYGLAHDPAATEAAETAWAMLQPQGFKSWVWDEQAKMEDDLYATYFDASVYAQG
jgi:hypothetical protein